MTDSSLILAFDADHVVRLTGLTHSQLRYWDKTKFFSPEYDSTQRTPFARIYSFQNVVGLRTLSILRNDYKIPLQVLRKVASKLCQYRNAPWSELAISVLGKSVYFKEPGGVIRKVLGGQTVLIELKTIAEDIAEAANKLRERTRDQIGRIEKNRYVVHNAFVVAGTRIPIKTIQRFREAGHSAAKIIREYPSLTEEDVKAALKYEVRPKKRA